MAISCVAEPEIKSIFCRPLIHQLVESFCCRQAGLYVSKFCKPNLRSPRKLQTQVVQTRFLFRIIYGHIVDIAFLQHLSAKPLLLAASEIRLSCSGQVMVRSNAAGCPADQQGIYLSPGFQLLNGNKFFQTGANFAAEEAANIPSIVPRSHTLPTMAA